MPHHEKTSLSGKVTDVFAHRFVLETLDGERVLADLGPHGADQISLATGDKISIEGDRHPSEIKVGRLTRENEAVEIERPKPKPPQQARDRGPEAAIKALAATGVRPVGEPRRRPHHFEITAEKDGKRQEYHVHDDGRIHPAKSGPAPAR